MRRIVAISLSFRLSITLLTLYVYRAEAKTKSMQVGKPLQNYLLGIQAKIKEYID